LGPRRPPHREGHQPNFSGLLNTSGVPGHPPLYFGIGTAGRVAHFIIFLEEHYRFPLLVVCDGEMHYDVGPLLSAAFTAAATGFEIEPYRVEILLRLEVYVSTWRTEPFGARHQSLLALQP